MTYRRDQVGGWHRTAVGIPPEVHPDAAARPDRGSASQPGVRTRGCRWPAGRRSLRRRPMEAPPVARLSRLRPPPARCRPRRWAPLPRPPGPASAVPATHRVATDRGRAVGGTVQPGPPPGGHRLHHGPGRARPDAGAGRRLLRPAGDPGRGRASPCCPSAGHTTQRRAAARHLSAGPVAHRRRGRRADHVRVGACPTPPSSPG